MIIETTINLKNKSKEELISLLNESLGVIEKLQKENEKLKRFASDVFNENEYVYYRHKDGTISTCPEIEIKYIIRSINNE